jgi:hypothetical protein
MRAFSRPPSALYDKAIEVLEDAMKFLCLVYGDEKTMQEMPFDECIEYDNKIRKSGHCLASESLQPTRTAATVRVRGGKLNVTDGPFMETKEVLAGFYLVEAANLSEAIQIAAKIPPAEVGCIEVRPIRPIREMAPRGAEAEEAR